MAEAGILKGITDVRVADIPVGGVAVGLLASGFVDGLMGLGEGAIGKKLPVWAVKGLGAYAANRWLPRYIGTDGAKFATAILAVDAIQSLYDFRNLTAGLFKKAGVGGALGRAYSPVGQEIPDIILPPELMAGVASTKISAVDYAPEEEVLVSVT